MHYIMDKVEEVINGGDGSREEAQSNDVENLAIPMAMPATTFNASNGQPILMLSSPVYIMETDPTATTYSTSPHHPPLGATQVASVSTIQLVEAGECLEGGTEEPDWKELFLSTINQILGELSHELHELKYAAIISRNLANEAQDALTNLLERTYGAIKEMKNAAVENNGRERKEAVTKAFSEVSACLKSVRAIKVENVDVLEFPTKEQMRHLPRILKVIDDKIQQQADLEPEILEIQKLHPGAGDNNAILIRLKHLLQNEIIYDVAEFEGYIQCIRANLNHVSME